MENEDNQTVKYAKKVINFIEETKEALDSLETRAQEILDKKQIGEWAIGYNYGFLHAEVLNLPCKYL